MTISLRSLSLTAACLLFAAAAGAQTAPAQPSSASSDEPIRPATTTFSGDTGLWFVPTADVLARRTWSLSAYRAGFNYREGFTNVGVFDGTFAVGVGGNTEIFGSLHFDRRIDRDLRPLFTSNADVGGVVPAHPLVRQGWTGDNIGDLYLGFKSNLVSQERGKPASFAVRALFKIPTADTDQGIGTGKVDADVRGIVSRDVNRIVEMSGYGGVTLRGSATAMTLPNSFNWGVGAGFPSHSALRLTTEVNGDMPFSGTATLSSAPAKKRVSVSPEAG